MKINYNILVVVFLLLLLPLCVFAADSSTNYTQNSKVSEYYTLFDSKNIDNVEISIQGDFNEEGYLSIKKLKKKRNLSEDNIVQSISYDIKVLNSNNEEIQPIDKVDISFNYPKLDENLTANIYHEGEPLKVEEHDNTLIVESDSFSTYTVEFTYEDKEYALEGDTYAKLSDLLSAIGLNGEVTSWEVSDTSLFNIFRGTEDEVSYEYEIIDENIYEFPVDNPNGDVLYVVPLQMFNTEEWLKVVIEGIEYEIKVTDDNIYQNVPSSYSGNISTNNDDNIAITGDTYFLNAPKPDYVMQSQSTTSATDFAAGLPLSTIFIDVDKIGNANNIGVQGEFTLLTENEAIRNGFEHYYTTDGSGNNMQLTGDVVMYNPLADTENLMQIEPNKINVLEGDLFQFIYRDAAILPNGNRAHVKMVYSNAKIAVDQRLGITDTASGLTASNYQGAIYLARGGTVARGGTDERYLGWRSRTSTQEPNQPFTQAQKQAMVDAVDNTISTNWGQSYTTTNMNSTETPVLGQSIDVKYQVVDDDGHPIDGTFIFAVTGVNLDRDPYAVSGNNTAKPVWNYTAGDSDLHFFSEAMSINQGKVSDYIYVRPNTNVFESNELKQRAEASNPPSEKYSYYYAQVIEDANGNVKFIGNGYGPSNLGGNDLSYNAGFVVLANAKDGITITSTGHATSRLGMNTQAWGGVQIWYRYISSTGPGGNIKTTSEGNYDGTLNDASDQGVNSNILDAGTYVVPEGKDVTYTMTPNDGYQIKRLVVKNANGSLREIKFNSKPLSTMEEGETYSFNDAAGRRCTLTALADGKFKLVMPYAKHDEEVRVEWERIDAAVKIKKSTIDNLSGTFNFKVKAQKKEDITTYSPELIGSIWKDTETGLYNMQLSEGITCELELNDLVGVISPAIYSQRLEIEGTEYAWGNTLWKTNIKLSDLGFNIDDDLFVGFANIPSSVEEEPISIALDTGYSAAGPERIYIYNPKTTLHKDVVTYWNFNTPDGQGTDPGWYNFTVDAGEEKTLTIQRGYSYEVQEVNNANWELLDIDGNPIQSATGILNDEVINPEHEFLNREVPDLTIKKETVNNAPGTFEFKVKVWQEHVESVDDEVDPRVIKVPVDLSSQLGEVDNDGYYHFNLNNDESLNIPNLPYGAKYEVIEVEQNEWSLESSENTTGVMSKDNTVTFTNKKNISLTVKKITDEETNEKFKFEVKIWKDVTPPIYMDLSQYSGVETSEEGVYEFEVGSGEEFIIPNIPYGYQHEVYEIDNDGNRVSVNDIFNDKWQLESATNTSGVLTENKTSVFTNNIRKGTIDVKKETKGNEAGEFDFKIRFKKHSVDEQQPPDDDEESVGTSLSTEQQNSIGSKFKGFLSKNLRGSLSWGSIAIDDNKVSEHTWEYSFKLNNGENLSFTDIPYGIEYEVWEEMPEGWELVSIDDLASVDVAEGTINTDSVDHIFLNAKKKTLAFSKQVIGNIGDKSKNFEFEVKFYTLIDGINTPVDLNQVPNGFIRNAVGTYTINLQHNDYVEISNIPYGYNYTISEKNYTLEGYTTTVDGVNSRVVSSILVEDKEHEYINTNQAMIPTKITTQLSILIFILILTLYFIYKRKEVKIK